MKHKNIIILGGSGFVGQRLAAHLAAQDYKVSILSRNPEKYRGLSLAKNIHVVSGDPFDAAALENAFTNQDAVINLVGILNERKDNGKDFQHAHVDLTHRVVMACEAAGVPRLLHMSALHADAKQGSSYYLRSKGEAEDWAHHAAEWGLRVTSFRPSVIFGEQDSFLNRFAGLLKLTPIAFPLACPNSRFAPVYVNDVVKAFAIALEDNSTIGKSYNLCGPKIYTLRQLVAYTAQCMKIKRSIIGLPDLASRMQAWVFGKMPGKPFTMDNYRSLQTDSVCEENGLDALGIKPTSLESIAPFYLGNAKNRYQYDDHRKKPPYSVKRDQ